MQKSRTFGMVILGPVEIRQPERARAHHIDFLRHLDRDDFLRARARGEQHGAGRRETRLE
jgi:hypothetical protein